jgi:signal recognition particle receptor subunit beta
MAETRSEHREVNARIVYWGIEGAGKATNLRAIHAKLRPDHRGRLEAMPTRLDPSVCWYRLPIELGELAGVRTRIQIVAVPGGPEQAPTRKQLLDRVDGVVFVVDARRDRIDANAAALDELRAALGAYGRSLEQVPLVVQCNHQDESDPFVLEELHRKLDVRGAAVFEANAREGVGVLPTLTTISKRVVRHLRETEAARGTAAPTAPGAGASAARPAPAGPATTPTRPPAAALRPAVAPAAPPPLERARVHPAPPPAAERGVPAGPPLPRPAGPARPAAFDLEQAALEVDSELEQGGSDPTLARAQGLLDGSWRDLTAATLRGTQRGAATPLPPARVHGGGLALVSIGDATITGPRSLALPVALADDSGRELRFRLTLSLDPLLDDE